MVYKTKLGTMCFTACLVNYLQMIGCELNEADIIFNEKTRLVYFKSEQPCNKYLELNYVESIDTFSNQYSIKYVKDVCNDSAIGKKNLEKCIHYNIPITISIDAAFLNYAKIFENSRTTLHAINVIGEYEDSFIISDSFIPSNPASIFEGKINKLTLCEAWRKAGYRHYKWYLSKVNCKNRMYNLVQGMVTFMDNYVVGGENTKECFGINAIEQMAIGIKNAFMTDKNLYIHMLTQLNYDIIVHGFCAGKELFVKGLKIIFNNEKLIKYQYLVNEAANIAYEWSNFNYYFLYCANVYKQKKMDGLLSRIENLIIREKKLYITLISILLEENFNG